ncbi:MAG: hypothetical protein V7K85_13320 [Nostoc sp.]
MNSLKKSMYLATILAFTLSFLVFCFPRSAMAIPSTFATLSITEEAQISAGNFSINKTIPLQSKTVVRSAKLFLPIGETGTINKIQITGPNGLEFGCQDIKVKDGVDLIKACGGPGALEGGGEINYVAEGSDFEPELNTKLKVVLSDDF